MPPWQAWLPHRGRRSGAPEIKGSTSEYLEPSSPRSQQICEANRFQGPAAPFHISRTTRESAASHPESCLSELTNLLGFVCFSSSASACVSMWIIATRRNETQCSRLNYPAYLMFGRRHDSDYSRTCDRGRSRPSSPFPVLRVGRLGLREGRICGTPNRTSLRTTPTHSRS